MTPRVWFIRGLAGFALVLAGCGPMPPATGPGEGLEPRQTTYKAGTGLSFPDETRQALGLRTVEVAEQPLPFSVTFPAEILTPGPPALASAGVPVATADALEGRPLARGRLVRVDRGAVAVTGEADLIVALDSPGRPGEAVTVTLTTEAPDPVTVIPLSALLRTTVGLFVYVENGGAFLRTPVAIGRTTAGQVEVTDGLYAGDVIVAAPVEQLWLAELRFTKGGGHSH